jgi:PEP-CTERM motif
MGTKFKIALLSAAAAAAATAIPASAAVLQSPTLVALQLPTNCTPPSSAGCGATFSPKTAFGAIEPAISGNTSAGFAGTWSASGPASTGGPVAAAWVGTFTATGGFYPSSPVGPSTTLWNFSGLSGGFLPTRTYVDFGDLDFGSGLDEMYDLMAFNAAGTVIKSPWLDGVFFVSSAVDCITECVQAAMPEYVWNSTTGVYEFDGLNVNSLNPTDTVWLTTNTDIYQLSVQKFSTNNSFGLAAPNAVPEPAAWALMLVGFGGLGTALRARRRTMVENR